MNTHADGAWKDILDIYLPEFFAYCLPDFYKEVDWGRGWESLDKELRAITKEGLTGTRIVDKLAKVFLKGGDELIVFIHLEVQGTPDPLFSKRMFTYATRIIDRYDKPILSCAILTDDVESWRPHHYEVAVGGSRLRIDFIPIKLLDYKTKLEKLEASRNPFATVILVQLAAQGAKRKSDNERLVLKFELTRRLYEKGFTKEEVKSLFIFLDWLLNLPHDLECAYQASVHQLEEAKKMPYVTSFERMGIEKGIQQGLSQGISQGRQEGEVAVLLRQLTRKFGLLPPHCREQIMQASSEQLLEWADQVLEAHRLEDIFEIA